MAVRTTRWSPDTCNCVVEYNWDDSLPPDQVTLSPAAVVSRCPDHTPLPADIDVYNSVAEENPRKNISHGLVLDNGPNTIYDLDNNGNRVFKNGINLSWTWSGTAPNRVLTLTLNGSTLTNTQKNAIRTALSNRFGTGKVALA